MHFEYGPSVMSILAVSARSSMSGLLPFLGEVCGFGRSNGFKIEEREHCVELKSYVVGDLGVPEWMFGI